MISHSPDQPFGCRVCPKCSIRFKQEKDQKRHCMERCKHRGCCINGVCQLQTSTPQSAQNTPNTQTPQYSPNRQNRTSPPFSSYSQSPQQQTPYINRNVGLNPVDSQSQHIPQSVLSHFTGDAEAMKQQSPHFRPNPASGVPVVQSAPALSSNSALATVIQSEQSKELKLGEDRIAQEVHYRRLGQIEEDIYNPLLAFVTQVELNPASHLGNGSESTTWEVLSVDEIFSEWIESFDTN
ncbi:hypothetical protein L211DRAFT_645301 [Terfezia boudieri ATCC MYA-4762]|uniref:Uncharacterized protein n=1 Tax=Terfezia boudieri ATCC MYA-4762 TaxID=1051890 RepID=A0A3N4MAI9_9PEZI|nr:hypothetical protein L211DRAFT_645301 [Terfezia boudieri ATCC MYA-4762]